ncbi:NADP-dependent 3-hydroxy acid dehydrogenase YdfG [Burkholderia sp. YR290]|uniref:SDR family NAD(P)-dependent oxidoreductase n=1 Tax=Paraburkholderia hospita TaxID=169430 RepID=UPI0009A836CD|nr:SDR family NAD(P)-dependent oxidoreductase [Paraburkholderia hospita]SKC93538.1 NADP-dependent 3-hydroxy acid dehydrogenase YdfG [Paraburkholderia hospita]SOE90439.1 NADP-dependent 3-hydroxy acid dehydrogenase YdfG [Burkholderia sp. YR290]
MSSQKWFITGASGGLGLALTEKVLAQGHRVVAAVRRIEGMRALTQAYPDMLEVESVDVTDREQVQAAAARHPDVDVVVNNAGGAVIGAMEEMSDADIEQQIALNLLAPIHVTRAFLGALRAKQRGTFIHVSSVGGRAAFPGGSMYHAAKFGLEGFAEAVSQEVAEFGIKTIIIEPGSIKTGFVANIRWTPQLDHYKDSTVARLRRWIEENGEADASGDPVRMAEAIYTISQMSEPPLRTVLGGDAYAVLEAGYTRSLAALQAQKDLAASVMFEGKSGFMPE